MPDGAPSPRKLGSRVGRTPRSLVAHLDRWTRITITAFLLLVVGLAALLGANRLVFEPRVQDAVEAARLVRLIHEAMLDEETSLRAFLVAGDDAFLETYEEAEAALGGLNESAQRLLAHDATDASLMLDLRVAQQAWRAGWTGDALAMGRAGASDAERAERDELLLDGKELFDDYRATYHRLADRLVAQREQALANQSDALLLTLVVALAVTAGMALLTLRNSHALRRATAGPLSALVERLQAMTSGDLSARPPVGGPLELRRLDEGLAETAAALERAREQEEEQSTRLLVQNRQLAQVLRVAREVAGSLNLHYVVRGVCEAASTIAERRVVVWIRSDDLSFLEACADTAGPGLEPLGLEPIEMGDGVVGRSARYGRIEGHVTGLLDGVGAGDELAVPMVIGAEVVGVLQILGQDASRLPVDTLGVLEALAVHAAAAIEAARLHEHTAALALTDALTHLPNRRRLEADLATEAGVSVRHDRPLAFAMLDVDHFKAYNDELGHQAADVALQDLATVLSEAVRAGDTVYRYGGEELAIVMRETTAASALHLAERLRGAVEHHFAAPGKPRAITVSIGVASMPEHGRTSAELVAAADAAMYDAKRSGRNRTCVARSSTLTD